MTDERYRTCNGIQLKALAQAGLNWLESHYQRVNELNVFPVPDGDTGTNMLLTMRNAHKEVADSESRFVGKVAGGIAHGAIMGSRGNSGTIMSQLWLGFARVLDAAETFDAQLMVKALRQATDTAYRGVQRPVEGTILTVAREVTEEAEAQVNQTDDLHEILAAMVARGWDAVERTPDMLTVLREAGVVDSGGTGLMYILEGMLRFLDGEPVEIEGHTLPQIEAEHNGGMLHHPGENFYDVQFVIKGRHLDGDAIKTVMESMGESAVVVSSTEMVKVHVHVSNPGKPLHYAANIGQISDVVVENMLEQYEAFAQQHHTRHLDNLELYQIEPGQVATIAVTPGVGLAAVFKDLSVSGLVNGGQTNNPSVEEFLQVIEALNTDKVILLPNNKNIILTAQKAAELSDREVIVVPTRSVPQGINAMLLYKNALLLDDANDLEELVEAMLEAKDEIVTAEITTATRSVELDGVKVAEGQVIGLLDGTLCAAGETLEEVVYNVLDKVDMDEMEILTLYYGASVQATDAHALAERLAAQYPALDELEVIYGGQPHYPYILSLE